MKLFVKSFALLAAFIAGIATAQPARFLEGTHYETIAKPVRTADPNKIEVTEVFWYGCPHCYAFEPLIDNWLKKLPADVAFVRSPGMWNPMMNTHAKILYVEQALGTFEKTHQLVFDTIQGRVAGPRNLLDKPDDIKAFFVAQGVDPAKFDAAWGSFAVATEVKKAEARMKDYGVSGVPCLIVNGKYRTCGRDGIGEAKAHDEMLQVVDFLVAKERAAAKK
ncbi:MAG TPA: thiol:disulfide interchange protein DsbA/DsbL [Candidatus Acidoferrum sp.]|nr:thiol:disulfide interchange protein DsbA/DsbL [Candidatus Acidoferrum sp.]